MSRFRQYLRKGTLQLRPYKKNEDLSKISVPKDVNPVDDMGMIVRNPRNPDNQWYMTREYFLENYISKKKEGILS